MKSNVNYPDLALERIRVKELARILNVSYSSARRYSKEIKESYGIRYLCMYHVKGYFLNKLIEQMPDFRN